MLRYLLFCLSLSSLYACHPGAPPKTIRLPAAISEASGLSIRQDRYTWHNDSGDGPYVYHTNDQGTILRQDTLLANASDNEDLTRDTAGRLYLGDFGNNRGQRKSLQIYRYDPDKMLTDTIAFTYPRQDGQGRDVKGNYDCEAMVYSKGYLHLFTKDQLLGKGNFMTYHFRLPAVPGQYVAELIDSLHLPHRVVTAAALDTVRQELVLTAYNFKYFLGFWPSGAASLITIKDFPPGRFLSGQVNRRNLAWFWPTQFEAVDFYDERWLYVASEATKLRKHAVGKRKRRR
ncbi:MAG: hypothetical protein AAF840_14945 [Bacteroidota bacterium]